VTANDELISFVRDGLARGASRAEIEDALSQAGWQAAQIRDALGGFADIPFPIPVPRPRPYVSARDAFLYLVTFSALYTVAINFGGLAFALIDRLIPDPAIDRQLAPEFLADAIRWPVSALIVATPLFLWVSSIVRREVARDPVARASKIRRWLTYMTLFVAASVLTGDVMALIYNVLGGELTTRFVLKAAVVAAISGTVFGYYLTDLRLDERGGAS
jgi:uncharacterized membrane protein